MLDNIQLIPGEAFTATGSVVEKVIDKVASAVGWVAMPRASGEYQLEAEKYLIEKIKDDKSMPGLAKAAAISNVRRLIKEYQNQYNILSIALNSLDNDIELEKLDDDWLSYFFDKAKNISKEDIALIWGKILAEEINKPNTVSKSLIHVLSIIDYKDATTFLKVANFSVLIEGEYYPVIFSEKSEIYSKNDLDFAEIEELADTGLIQQSNAFRGRKFRKNEKLIYFDSEIILDSEKEYCFGNVGLSKIGKELISIITNRRKIEGFAEFLEELMSKDIIELLTSQDD